MNTSFWTKKAMALPVCAAIVVGGVALVATPANADPADLKVTSQSVTGGVLTLTGLGTPGENVILQKGFPAERIPIAADGTWKITYTLPDTAAHTYELDQQKGLNSDGSTTITVAAQPAFAITSHTVSGRTITASGTGTPGNTVQIDPQSAPIARTRIDADGNWSFTYDIPASAGTTPVTYNVLEENDNLQIQAQGSFTAAAEAATPAPAQFSVTSPKNGATVSSRTVTFTGTGQEGDQINLLDTDGNRLGGFGNIARVGADQTWSLSVTFPDDAARQQPVRVTDVRGGSGAGDTTITITLPAAATAPVATPLTLVTPTDGSKVASRTVTYSGKGTPGDAIAVVSATGDVVAPATIVAADGSWTTTGTFSDSAATTQDLTVGEVDSDLTVVDSIDFSITLPAVATGTAPVTGTTPGAGTAPTTGTRPAGTLPVVAG
jgi:hypothetical protein